MASITKKKINGRAYYYARECAWVDGKPKIVSQTYLGTADAVIKAVKTAKGAPPNPPEEVHICQLGAVAALYGIAQRLKLVETVDRHAPKRSQGLTVGEYMLVAAVNRCTCPKSKAKIGDWFMDTPLRRWIPTNKKALSSKRFWDNMGHLDAEKIRGIEGDLASILVNEFDVDVRMLLYDTTNFFTFIDSFNDRSTLAQRGKSKECRYNLRLVGLALAVSMDFGIPLFHECFPGNVNDVTEFSSVTDRLVQRYRQLSEHVEHITLVIDKGNNSEENLKALSGSPYHFIGSLKLNQVPELLDVSRENFEVLNHPKLSTVIAYRTKCQVMGCERTVVLTFNENLYLTQSQTIFREAKKRLKKLAEIRARLLKRQSGEVKGGQNPTVDSVTKQIKKLLKGQHLDEVISYEVGSEDGFTTLEFSFDQAGFQELSRKRLGKTALFSDNDNWTTEEIILGYRGASIVEDDFRTMKDPHFVSWSPMFHWTDEKVRVHAFYCVVALTLSSLLQRELHRKGISVSIPEMLEALNGIREVALVHADAKEPQIVIANMTSLQKRLFEALELHKTTEASRVN